MSVHMTSASTISTDEGDDRVAAQLYSKVGWRILPFLMLCYVVAFLDRINIGYAQLQMKQTLTFSDATYGFGAGIFFVGYFLFEVPSNLLLERIGVRKTLLRIMFLWGIAAVAMAFVQTPTQFYVLRFLLGVLEAGFFPGIILYLTYWYPSARRGQIIAMFMTATAIASVLAGPLSGGTMQYLNDIRGWHGWQWLFISQGIPASILGLVAFFYLQDKPEDATWLTADEKTALRYQLEHDHKDVEASSHANFWQMIQDPKVYGLSFTYFLLLGATYTMVFWIPTLIKSWGVADLLHVGLLATLPQIAGIIGTVLMGRHSDKTRERRWHYVTCVVVASIGLIIISFSHGNLLASVIGLTLAGLGFVSATPLFFTTTTEYLSRASAAGGIALISSLGNLGPAVAPSVTGYITATTGSSLYSTYLIMAAYILSGLLLLTIVKVADPNDAKS
ncbi:MFS transporter [Bradyrhizobium jicamae]|uniref:MFS transporter n=1 Tax=Bradyrhizobium jicamae TaxID=280332 RepID=UPI002013985E|nr:MFS transporter [Bradyrhizobium jicamae]